jgi:hypothetical protein
MSSIFISGSPVKSVKSFQWKEKTLSIDNKEYKSCKLVENKGIMQHRY